MQNNQLINKLQEKFPEIKISEQMAVTAPPDRLLAFMQELKDNPDYSFNFLTNLTAVDYPENFTVVYNLVSFQHGYTLMVKVEVGKEDPVVPSVVSLWGGANWQEREVYDLMGITFSGHPDLRRILLEEHFKGYPLRKDFQWVGGRE